MVGEGKRRPWLFAPAELHVHALDVAAGHAALDVQVEADEGEGEADRFRVIGGLLPLA